MKMFKLAKEMFRGKSLSRSLVNLKLAEKNIVLSGRILDLGGQALYWIDGQPRGASYLRFIRFEKAEILRLDIDSNYQPDYKIDFERDKLPFPDNSVDNILVFNLFEHIFNYQFLSKEICRVIKPGGKVIGSVPFLLKVHPDPQDFFRYTEQALEKIFKEAGFKKIQIDYVGLGPFTNELSQVEFVLPSVLRVLCCWFSMTLDKIVLKIKPGLKDKFPLDYLFILTK